MTYTPSNPNGQNTMANSAPIVLASDQMFTSNPLDSTSALPVRLTPNVSWRTTFSKVISGGVDNAYSTLLQTGSGQTVNQTAGNLVMTAGTTINSETVVRSTVAWNDSFIFRYGLSLSQRIANNNFYVELVDIIGDGLSFSINSATSVTVTIPSNPFTSQNIGQFMYLGVIAGAAGIPGRYAIASVSGNNVNYTVASWPASGSGTLSVFGWNYQQLIYNSTTTTSVLYDGQRRGWNSGTTTAAINTTASPGHMGQVYSDDSISIYSDGLVASNTAFQTTQRASRLQNIPTADTQLYLQIRSVNSSTAPASTTTLTVNFVSVEEFVATPVVLQSAKQVGAGSALSVQVQNAIATTGSSTVTQTTGSGTTIWNAAGYGGVLVADIGSAAITSTTTTASITPGQVANIGTLTHVYSVIVTAASGTNQTMDVVVQESMDNGTNWIDVYHFPRITAVGAYVSPWIPSVAGTRIRYVQTIGGTSPSFTRSLNRIMYSVPAPLYRQFYDRSTIVLTTLNSTTPTFNVEGTSTVQMVVNIGAATTAPVLQLEGSDDNATTWYEIGTALTAVASSTVQATTTGILTGRLRVRVSTAGSAVTAGYVFVKAMTS
jgi:hypothetical protein